MSKNYPHEIVSCYKCYSVILAVLKHREVPEICNVTGLIFSKEEQKDFRAKNIKFPKWCPLEEWKEEKTLFDN